MTKFYRSRTSFVLDILGRDNRASRSILDAGFIGNYDEANVHYFLIDSLRESDKLTGIDIDREKMTRFLGNPKTIDFQAKKRISYEVGSIFNTSFEDSTFDYVLLLEVFEHLFSPYSVFEEIHRILKPGGSVIITYPNPLSLSKLLGYVRQKNLLNNDYLKNFRGAPDHKIFPHPVCFAIYLNDSGFHTQTIEFIKYDYFKNYSIFNAILAYSGLLRKLSAYVGVWAVKVENGLPRSQRSSTQ